MKLRNLAVVLFKLQHQIWVLSYIQILVLSIMTTLCIISYSGKLKFRCIVSEIEINWSNVSKINLNRKS